MDRTTGSETVQGTTVKVRSTLRFLGPDVLAQVQLPGFSLVGGAGTVWLGRPGSDPQLNVTLRRAVVCRLHWTHRTRRGKHALHR